MHDRHPHIEFRLLRTFETLEQVEELQRQVFGVSDLDLMAASMLIVLPETGGDVIGAIDVSGESETLAGFVTALGGFAHHTPRLCSDMLAVHPDYRHAGLGESLKRLQGALALERGFATVIWTVDPLRAANARLNFSKLGAYAERYERNRYGPSYGTGLYGGMPTDRLHVVWPILSTRVQSMLAGRTTQFPDVENAKIAIPIPDDIDALLTADPAVALRWRLEVRNALEAAFGEGLVVTGFGRDHVSAGNAPALHLTRLSPSMTEQCS